MDKLQLYITISHGGYQQLVDLNSEDIIKSQITDLSVALEDITYNPKEKHIFYMLRSTDQGVFVIVLRTIPDQPTDHLAAWIFVPSEIDIADADITRVVEEVSAIVSNPAIDNDLMNRLRELFQKAYPLLSQPGATVANHGKYFAHRFYGSYTGDVLSDLIGSKRYQTSYLPYAGVMLVDKSKASEIIGKDFTEDALDQMVRIFPPKNTSSYRPLIFGEPFDKPYLVPLMGTVEIIWENNSMPDVSQSVMVNRPDMQIEPIMAAVTETEAEKAETEAKAEESTQITVTAPKTEETQAEADSSTKPTPVTPPVTEEKAETDDEVKDKDPDVTVVEAKTVTAARPYTPTQEKFNIYNFEIPSKSADISGMIKFSIRTRNRLTESPIDGYELCDNIQEGPSRSNHLIYIAGNSLQNKALWAVSGFIVGVLLALMCTCSRSCSNADNDGVQGTLIVTDTIALNDTTTTPAANVPATAAAAAPAEEKPDVSMESAIRYLDTNTKWTKSELEQYPDLHGLYDDLNNINKERIIKHWGPKLKESRKFALVVEHTRLGRKKKPVFANPKPGQTTFNVGSDETIKVQSYLNCIDH